MIFGVHAMFYSDKADEKRAFLRDKFTRPIRDAGFGLVTFFKIPGDFQVQLYQPHYERKC